MLITKEADITPFHLHLLSHCGCVNGCARPHRAAQPGRLISCLNAAAGAAQEKNVVCKVLEKL